MGKEVLNYGKYFVVILGDIAYGFSFKSGFVVRDSGKIDAKRILDALKVLDSGFLVRNKSVVVYGDGFKRVIKYEPDFAVRHEGRAFFRVGYEYKTVVDGLEVATKDFKRFVVKSGIGVLGVKGFDEAKELVNLVKGLKSEYIRGVEPYFYDAPSARFRIKYSVVSVAALGKIINERLRLYRVAMPDGIYDLELPLNDLDGAIENYRDYVRKVHVKVRAEKIKKVTTPAHRPGTAMYVGPWGNVYVSLGGKAYYRGGKEYEIKGREVDLCSLKK